MNRNKSGSQLMSLSQSDLKQINNTAGVTSTVCVGMTKLASLT